MTANGEKSPERPVRDVHFKQNPSRVEDGTKATGDHTRRPEVKPSRDEEPSRS
jgi:hypothetical protein